MNFILYLAVYASTYVALYFLPTQDVSLYLSQYTAYNTIGSLLLTVLLSSEKRWLVRLKIYWLLFAIAVGFLAVASFKENKFIIYAGYPIVILLTDYFFSQNASEKIVRIFRLYSLSTVIFFFFDIEFWQVISLRSVSLVLPVVIFKLLIKSSFKKLEINSAVQYLVAIYLSYSGVLYLLVRVTMSAQDTKYWYVVVQFGLALMLKMMDFKTRGSSLKLGLAEKMIWIVNIIMFASINAVAPSIAASALFILGFIGLIYADKAYLK